ncbi:AMP-binding protein [Brevibacterium litoralis]|uniref:AMP-binding protein n=1 Tax=Brevibacterium litoralis TaxID=3138935 RepID=UPI0032EB92DE
MTIDTGTMPQILARRARETPQGVAMQEKRYGIWQTITWSVYHDRVTDFAQGLTHLGIKRGDLVAVLGDNRPEWLISELATQALGAAVVGVYPTAIGEEIMHVLRSGGTRVVVAEDQEQVDKLLTLRKEHEERGEAFLVEHIVYYDPQGLESYDDPMLLDFTEVEALGRTREKEFPGAVEESIAAGSADDLAVICTTSGTTSAPKLAQLTHSNLLSMAERLGTVDPLDGKDRYVSILPFAWIGEQMLAVACGLSAGFTVSFPEDSSTQRFDMREVGPSLMFAPPRIWESFLTEVQIRIDEAGPLKRALFGWGYEISDRIASLRDSGKEPGAGLKFLGLFADLVATRPIREQLGITRIKRCYTGGAPLGPDVFRFFHAIGVNLKQIYGQTEICGIAVIHRNDEVKFDTVGEPLPETELRFGEKDEIQLRSASVFRGYVDRPDATAEALTEDGWLHTGDAGYLDDDGHLVVVDRMKDVRRTPDGTMYSYAFVENKLKFSPYIEEAVVFAGASLTGSDDPADSHGLSAIITIDPQTTGAWAEHTRLAYTTYQDLASKPEVQELVGRELAQANEGLEESIRVARFVLLHKQFDPDDDEITRTRKVRRNVVGERYATLVEAVAAGAGSVDLESRITYQDGTSVDRTIPLRILPVTPLPADGTASRRKVWSGRP